MGIGPIVSIWVSSAILEALHRDVFGRGRRCILPRMQGSQRVGFGARMSNVNAFKDLLQAIDRRMP